MKLEINQEIVDLTFPIIYDCYDDDDDVDERRDVL